MTISKQASSGVPAGPVAARPVKAAMQSTPAIFTGAAESVGRVIGEQVLLRVVGKRLANPLREAVDGKHHQNEAAAEGSYQAPVEVDYRERVGEEKCPEARLSRHAGSAWAVSRSTTPEPEPQTIQHSAGGEKSVDKMWSDKRQGPIAGYVLQSAASAGPSP
eukprot:scaffold37720_cov67-Phaeocystis_antarctica.AAC.6